MFKSMAEKASSLDATDLNNVAWGLVSSEDESLREPALAVELAQKAVKLDSKASYSNTLGVAHYRARQWPQAIDALNNAVEQDKQESLFGYSAFYLAMSYCQLNQKEESRHWFDKGVKWMSDKQLDNDIELAQNKAEAEKLIEETK